MGPTSPELEVPDGPLVDGRLAARSASTTRGCECSMSAGGTRARRCRTPSAPSTPPRMSRARCSSTGSTTSSTRPTRCRSRSPTPTRSPRAPASSGIGDGDLVVTYDDYYGIFAARVAWAFRYYGAEARVLDGGWSTWARRAGRSAMPARRISGGRSPPARGRACVARCRCRGRERCGCDACRRAAATPVHRRARALRTPGTSPDRAACPTRSSSTARPGCGRRRQRSHDSPGMRGSTQTARRES